MELTKHIENYKNTLNKTQQKQFDKILDIFEPLRPHTIHKVTNPRSQGCPRFQSGEELANSVGKINAC